MSTPLWSFSDSVSEERQSKLLGISTFDQVAEHVASSCEIKYYTDERATGEDLKGCTRASFLLKVEEVAYDAFFNSPLGYRAQYCSSSDCGEAANRQLLQLLTNKLLQFGRSGVTGFNIEMVTASLEGKQAKIWVLEDVATMPRPSLNIEILYQPWVEAAMNNNKTHASWRGVLAPRGKHLEVKGGWFKSGNPFIYEGKVNRSEKIKLYGFAA